MSNMKCPFCQQTIACTGAQDADEYTTWFCPRCVAERNWCAFGNETLWQELIRTRRALDVAVDAINKASDALIGCQEADNKHISDITAEDALELLSEYLGKIRFLQKDK